MIKRIVSIVLLFFCLNNTAWAVDYTGGETLNYQVVYHWGVIWKHAADATLSIKKQGTGYQARLTAKTRSWADKVYPVRDTLLCVMNGNLRPQRYEKYVHEKDYYAHDVVEYKYNFSHTNAHCTRYRSTYTESTDLNAQCQAYDMLSVFYMLRDLDPAQLERDKRLTTVIFSGKEKEYLTIFYKGREQVKLRDGSKHDAYRLSFKFTTKGGQSSSDGIEAWLSTDDSHIPLMLLGKLSIGEVRAYCVR